MLESLMKKLLNRETITYLIAGVLTTILNIVVFKGCNLIGIQYLISNVIAWVGAVIFAFVVNKLYVFQSKSWESAIVRKEFVAFISCRLLSLAFDMAFMLITVSYFHMNEDLAKILSNFFVVVMNYVASKLFIFKDK